MLLATWNVNGIRARSQRLMEWLAEREPDVACLQELKAAQEKFPHAALREAGYRAIWHGQKAWNGVAILARGEKPDETRRGLPGDPDDTHSRYIEAVVGGITVGLVRGLRARRMTTAERRNTRLREEATRLEAEVAQLRRRTARQRRA